MEIPPPKRPEEVVLEIQNLTRTGSPDQILDYVKKYPGFIQKYIEMNTDGMMHQMREINLLVMYMAKVRTDDILKDHKSDQGGIPFDMSAL